MKWQTIAGSLVLLLLGMAIGYAVRAALPEPEPLPTFIERREGGYKFINPLLECDLAGSVLRSRELRPFKEKIESYLNRCLEQGQAARVSVYFRELNDGQWFSIGETERFVPASLRKVPLMIALLKMAETGDRGLLDRPVKCELANDYNAQQNFKPSQSVVPGGVYTVRELMVRMIVYSDNNAFTLLAGVVNPGELQNVYATLRMPGPHGELTDEFLSIQTYASFLRVLYNATYLSKTGSEWALALLAKSELRAGLVAGVPAQIEVAHKFGEHAELGDGTVQLHDCGIVYYPQHPYLLCVMSRGAKFEGLDQIIAEVSRIAFAEIEAQHRKD